MAFSAKDFPVYQETQKATGESAESLEALCELAETKGEKYQFEFVQQIQGIASNPDFGAHYAPNASTEDKQKTLTACFNFYKGVVETSKDDSLSTKAKLALVQCYLDGEGCEKNIPAAGKIMNDMLKLK